MAKWINKKMLVNYDCKVEKMKFTKVSVVVLGLILFSTINVFAETVDLELFEKISATIKNKQNAILLDESPIKIGLLFSQPQRKIQSNSELSESTLSAE